MNSATNDPLSEPNLVDHKYIAVHISKDMYSDMKLDLIEFHEMKKWLRTDSEAYHNFRKFEILEILKR